MKKYIKWGAVILVLVSLLVFNFALIFERNNQRVAATPLAPGEPAQTDIYVGNVVSPPAPTSGGCCSTAIGSGSSTAALPSCH
jgi:hypothetical protein